MSEIAQQAHHLIRCLVIGGRVGRQKRRVRTAAGRAAQRHPGVHPEPAGLIGGARHHLAGFGGIATAADDHGQADQLGVAAQLDGGQELIEVHVQDPHPRFGVFTSRTACARRCPTRRPARPACGRARS